MVQIKFEKEIRGADVWRTIQKKLSELGIDLERLAQDLEGKSPLEGKGPAVRVVCVAPDLQESVEEMGKSPRDQVVMVRVDEATARSLDAWVETGAVRSRSEAAALFIREGFKIRAAELEQLQDALRAVDEAKQRLSKKAREVFGQRSKSAAEDAGNAKDGAAG